MPTIDIVVSPAEFPYYECKNHIVVVIDIFRATSSIVTAFANGAQSMIPVKSIEEAHTYKQKGYLVAGERNGIPIEGFDFGNSPLDFTKEKVLDKNIVITTTNGTQAMEMAKQKGNEVIVGSFLNINAVIKYLVQSNKNVTLFCAGWKNKFNLEDYVCAGMLAHHLYTEHHFELNSDAALLGYLVFDRSKKKLKEFLNMSSHKKRLENSDLDKDIDFCLQQSICNVVPVLKKDALVLL